jgi:hypothetical protein
VSKWDDRVRNHPVHASLASAQAALEHLSTERSAQAAEDVERLSWVIDNLRERLDAAPGFSMTPGILDPMNQQLSQIANEVNSYNGNGNVAHLANANSYTDTLLDIGRSLPQSPKDRVGKAASRETERVRRLVSQVVSQSETEIEKLNVEAASTSQRLNTARTEFAEQASAIEQRMIQAEARITDCISQLDAESTAHQTQFAQEQKDRESGFQENERERANRAEGALKEYTAEFDDLSKELVEKAKAELAQLADLQKQADELVGAIGVTGVAAGYNETAQQQRRAANQWRLGTVGIAFLAAVVLSSALFIDHGRDDTWQLLTTRLVISLSFAGLAAYCGRQSAEHRREERTARARQIQLAALNPYLANMPEDERVKLKSELAVGYFTAIPEIAEAEKKSGTEGDGLASISTAQLITLVKMILTKGGS